jgi:hypothetical protein
MTKTDSTIVQMLRFETLHPHNAPAMAQSLRDQGGLAEIARRLAVRHHRYSRVACAIFVRALVVVLVVIVAYRTNSSRSRHSRVTDSPQVLHFPRRRRSDSAETMRW